MTLLRWLTFLIASLTVTLTVLLFRICFFFDTSICFIIAFLPFENSDHVIVSVSIEFPSNSKRDTLFHCIAYDYSCAEWDILYDPLGDVPWEDIFKLIASAATSKFCEWKLEFRFELMYIFLIVSIKSSHTHLHVFQLLVLLP